MPGVVISALRGGSGKTLISVGIIAALNKLGKKVAPFKKGPDYIDAGWLALAAGRSCYNLDTYLTNEEEILHSFYSHTNNCDIAVVEGNRGLYDGIDLAGSTSTANLSKLLNIPVILCIDSTKTTRTMAAAVLGCREFDPDVKIIGVILNRVAGSRHEQILRRSIEHYCSIPVFGALPKIKGEIFPQRHMGLVPTPEHLWAKDSINKAGELSEKYIDLNSIKKIVKDYNRSKEIHLIKIDSQKRKRDDKIEADKAHRTPRIGIVKDTAFQFYYPENIEALKLAGAETVFISSLDKKPLPSIDALYIGGGFPETHAEKLAENKFFLKEIKELAGRGFPIYAECGGLIYLGEKLVIDDNIYEMTGVLPVVFGFSKKPQGHGYTKVAVEKENPFFAKGTILMGHEFHYSKVLKWGGGDSDLVFSMQRGRGFINQKDGVCKKNVLATYTHIHALGTPFWAEAIVENAIINMGN